MTQPAPDAPSELGADGERELGSEAVGRIHRVAARFVADLERAAPGSASFRRAIGAIERLGAREIAATAAIASRFQDLPVRAVARELADSKAIATHSRELHRIAERLTPGPVRSAAGDLAFARAVARGEPRIRQLVQELDAAGQVLEVDNGQLGQQERALWIEIRAIRQQAAVAAAIDEVLDARIGALEPSDPERARHLRDEVQYAVRRRRSDLLTELAVATQGYAALRRIEQGNLELIWLIRAMSTTTASALRTAALAARLLAGRTESATAGLAEIATAWREVLEAVDRVEERRSSVLAELARP